MRKNKSQLSKILSNKKNQLNWQRFNLLENLLIFCTHRDLSVPKESGVQFRIALADPKPSLCLLFRIDRETDPLVTMEVYRPDYMVLYITNDDCICTIVEMKGASGLSHGVDQVKSFRQIIRKEISERLPNRFRTRLYIQAILLAPYNSQIPNKQIAREAANGFLILPLLYHHKAELFPYVSRRFLLTEKYEHKNLKNWRDRTFIENLLNDNALPDRIKDSLYEQRSKTLAATGIYVNYLLSKTGDYGALLADAKGFVLGLNETNGSFQSRIRAELMQIGFLASQDFHFEVIN